MSSRRERFERLSPQEYERAIRSSAQLAKELAEARGEKPPAKAIAVLDKKPGQISAERKKAIEEHATAQGEREVRTGGEVVVPLANGGTLRATPPDLLSVGEVAGSFAAIQQEAYENLSRILGSRSGSAPAIVSLPGLIVLQGESARDESGSEPAGRHEARQ